MAKFDYHRCDYCNGWRQEYIMIGQGLNWFCSIICFTKWRKTR